jgi:N-acyl-D-amino-acid deacylase
MNTASWDIIIKNAKVAFPGEGEIEQCSLGIADGEIVSVGDREESASRVIDASGYIVSPGFIDIHMHNEEKEDPYTVQQALLLQGVTTALAGNCGTGLFIDEYKSMMNVPYLNLAILTGHSHLRETVGINSVYKEADDREIAGMCQLLEAELQKGSFGLSFGLEYAPNTTMKEIESLCDVLTDFEQRLVSVHIRHDGPASIGAVQEMIDLARKTGLRIELSHLGSMTAFGVSGEVLEMVNNARSEGIDIRFDTYPYAAFCTYMGSTVFDPGFEKRWNKGMEALEVASGPHKGKRLDQRLYDFLRSQAPQTLIVAHVMDEEEIRACLRHPLSALGSDAVLQEKGGHPRAAGAFPRGIRWLREDGLSWAEALAHATATPAESLWLNSGCIIEGAPADLVVFDPDVFIDNATFENPLLPPDGIKWVILGGQVVVEKGIILESKCGKFLFRSV